MDNKKIVKNIADEALGFLNFIPFKNEEEILKETIHHLSQWLKCQEHQSHNSKEYYQ